MWKSGVHPYPSSPLGQMQQPFSSQQQHSQKITGPPERNVLYPMQSNDKSCAPRSAIAQWTTCAQNCKKSKILFNTQKSCARRIGHEFCCLLNSNTDLSQRQVEPHLCNKPPLPFINSSLYKDLLYLL